MNSKISIMSDFKQNKELARQLIFDLKCSVCEDLPGPNGVRKFRYACQNGHLVCEGCISLECFCKSKNFSGPSLPLALKNHKSKFLPTALCWFEN